MTNKETERLIKLEVKVDDISADVSEIKTDIKYIKTSVENLDSKYVTRREALAISSFLVIIISLIGIYLNNK